MKVSILNVKKVETGQVDLPEQFAEPVRSDIVRRAVLAIEANMRQRYGADPRAGMKHSTDLRSRRKVYRGHYGFGISRSPRKIMSRNGSRLNWVGAEAPFTVGGRRAHPPKATKLWGHKINTKERRKAIRSALAATINTEIVTKRGHKVPANYPFAIDSDFEGINKTKALVDALKQIGLQDELTRSSVVRTRGGHAARRGRRLKKAVGPLIVVSKTCDALKAAQNIPGVEITTVNALNAKLLAPGCHVGRLTLYTKDALEAMRKEKLYM